ncbi:MAG: hypothetical protein IT159_07745 [Bryobacterales bacterium]|nr:hypothetical protein [Bryobacterales bacterium]
MKRKPAAAPERAVPREVLERARKAFKPDLPKAPCKCVVCGSPCAPNSTEGLCWVCRRLKISAWHEGDQQVSAQE